MYIILQKNLQKCETNINNFNISIYFLQTMLKMKIVMII